MHLLLAGLFVLQSGSITVGTPQADTIKPRSAAEARRDSLRQARRDSVRSRRDSLREERERRGPRRAAVTPELLASAFRSPAARTLLERARAARLEQDSTLVSYDARSVSRISAGMSLKRLGRDRLLFRHENASRVRWSRDHGAWVDVTGRRTAVPGIPQAKAELGGDDDIGGHAAIPYYPGRDALWVGSGNGVVKREVNEDEIVHPLAEGAEAYYRYSTGDAMSFRLPDGSEVRIVELIVAAREPRWNLIVGSFWFDASTAQLVRAAYRMSVPMDIVEVAEREDGEEDGGIPRWLQPMTANIRGITIEYGLHRGRWWLPRIQVAEGEAQVSFMRVPFRVEESFRYASVNGTDTLPAFPSLASADSAPPDSMVSDSVRHRRRSVDMGDAVVLEERRHDGALRVVTRTPKDTAALARSPDLPSSIYDSGEELFGQADVDVLMKELDLGLQAGWSPQRPSLHYGLERGLLRYNRVEGLSAGIAADQTLGKGYAWSALARIGTADWEPNGELALGRSDGSRTLGAGVYRRLAVAADRGDPLGLGASLNALLFARDEGLYYRTGGAELTYARERGARLSARLFAERQGSAHVETQLSLAKALNDVRFRENIDAERATEYGAAAALRTTHGLDPRGFRLLSDLRLEGGTGTFDYARGSVDATISHGLPWMLEGALTMAGGLSGGRVPAQRLWYLGGSQTVRGHPIASAAGDAFWLGRAELGKTLTGVRPAIFYDAGWAGDRDAWRHPGQPLSGAGVGASVMDGMIRFDVSKGVRPNRGWRTDLYLEARF